MTEKQEDLTTIFSPVMQEQKNINLEKFYKTLYEPTENTLNLITSLNSNEITAIELIDFECDYIKKVCGITLPFKQLTKKRKELNISENRESRKEAVKVTENQIIPREERRGLQDRFFRR